MNREIKFRAWDKKEKRMFEVYTMQFAKRNGICVAGYNMPNMWPKFNEVEIMEYTGREDKNGKEIYEGDYLRQEGLWVKVTWSEFDAGFVFADESGSLMSVTNGNVHNWEIDGNIYES